MMAILLAFLVAGPALSCVRAAALQLGWRWFLAPLFPGLPALGFVDALGLSLVFTLLVYSFTGADADEKANERRTTSEKGVTLIVRAVLFYGMYFIAAIIIHALQGSA